MSLLFITFIKGSIVFIIVYIALSIFRNLSPEFKHLIWFFLICGFVLIPLFSMMMPVFRLNVLSLTKERGEVYKVLTSMMLTQPYYSGASHLTTQSGTVLSQMSTQTPQYNFHWPFFASMIWVTGILVSFLRVVIGRICLLHMNKGERLNECKQYNLMLNQMIKRMGIDKEIVLLKSTKCKMPFSSNVFKPIVVFPSEIENWQEAKTRVVLSHELAHIRRRDYLTQYIARTICSIFWFIPLIWVAYFILHLEQEKACDSSVVNTGAKPTDYASHMLELAYFQSRRLLSAGLYITKGRKVLLEKRILNVLNVTKSNLFNKGGTKMKISR
jgi:beta-lactamase regulating signal transducer with metallopeptidase domain